MEKTIKISLLLWIFGSKIFAQDFEEAILDSLLSKQGEYSFNGVVLISNKNTIKYSRCKGFADVECKHELSDRFVIGSVSKQFTAVFVLTEFDRGHLTLSEPIKKYLPALSQPWADTVTIHHLLTHTHGISELENPLLFAPGTAYSYSQLGYELLGKIVERTSGKSLAQYSNDFFEKHKMHHTCYPDSITKKKVVKGFTQLDNENEFFYDSTSYMNSVAAGSFISSAEDLMRWNRLLHKGKLLKRSTYEKMIRAQPNAIRNHPLFGKTEYGYGITITNDKNLKQLGQTGLAPGFVSMNYYFPESKTSLIVLSNQLVSPNNISQTFYYHIELLNYVKHCLPK